MSTVIRVENLCKRYYLNHKERESFPTLRDAVARTASNFGRRLLNPLRASSGQPLEGLDSTEEFWALKDVSFEVKQGDRVGIIGRNGAGKSTLLKILSRITEPTRGRVAIKGRVASLLEVGTGFHPELTGRENIFLNGAILGMSRWEIQAKFDEIVDFAEVERFLDTPVKRYSSGMYVRLAFAVAAHLEPEILIVDEVLAVGDAQFQKKCLGKMEVVGREGRTVIFVSHNFAAVRQLCTSAIKLSDGSLKSVGTTEAVISSYLGEIRESGQPLGNGPLAVHATGITLNKLCLRDSDGIEIGAVEAGRTLFIDAKLSFPVPSQNCQVAITIDTFENVRICALHNEIVGDKLAFSVPGGILRCELPRVPLAPGNYYLTFKLKVDGQVIFYLPKIMPIMVESGDYFGTGRLPEQSWGGLFFINHSWRII